MTKTRSQNSTDIWSDARKILMSAAMVAISFSGALSASATSPGPTNPYDPNGQPRTYYVSKNGDNTDGRSWATAWNEMDQIHWTDVSPQRRDSLVIDGGVNRMVYRTTMKVQAVAYYSPVTVKVSTETSHNGQAVIAPGNTANGIEITSGGFILNGSKRSGILIYGAKNGMTINATAPYPFNVKNVEIAHCAESGVTVGAAHYPIPLTQMILHDNATNLVTKQNSTPGGASLSKCWIYNSTYLTKADGIRCDGSASGPPMPGVTLNNCVLGPGLRDGVNNLSSARPTLRNCLFINSTRNNVSSYSVSLDKVTSFMTKLNPAGNGHKCIKLQTTGQPYGMIGSTVKKSIFYGGTVEVPLTIQLPYPGSLPQPFPITVEANTQFRTTGNTTVLAAEMVDPKFRSPVGFLPNITPVALLMGLDFSLRDASPAAGTGSEVTSVKQLLSTFD